MPSYAQAPPQWCTDHCADAANHRGPLGVHRVRAEPEIGRGRGSLEVRSKEDPLVGLDASFVRNAETENQATLGNDGWLSKQS